MNLRGFPWRVLTRKRYDRLRMAEEERVRVSRRFSFLEEMPEAMAGFFIKNFANSPAQLHQDLFVLWETRKKKNGFFVEIGACDGLLFSNTYLLEKEYGWKGILVEPASCWWNELGRNRQALISHDFIAGQSGKTVLFNQATQPEYSGAKERAEHDHNASRRAGGIEYPVQTLSLEDLLIRLQAPPVIDFLSIDVEGGEYDILSGYPFEKHSIRIIFCEHNFTPQREKIHTLLTGRGYQRRYEEFSGFDDWYFQAER